MAKVSIVFEETDVVGGEPRFNVYLDGLTPERMKEINAMSAEEQTLKLSTAEFWALRCFHISTAAIAKAGAVQTVFKRGG